MCHAAVLDELTRELVTSGAMTNEGWEFSAAPFGKNSIPDSSSAPSWYASSTSSVYNKTQSAWPESWTGLCIEMRSFQCRCFWNMLPDNSVLSHSFRQTAFGVAWPLDANLNPDFNLQNPLFFAVAVGLLLERESSSAEIASLRCCNPGQVGAIATTSEGLLDLDTIAIHSNFCLGLLRDARRIVRSTCLDGASWSQNNEIVSNHCSILSLEGICSHKFHSEISPNVNFWSFVASSFWQRFSYNFAGLWNWAQQMLSPPGQSLEQFLHKTHFQPSGSRPISGVARVRRAVPQLIPEGLGTRLTSPWLGDI